MPFSAAHNAMLGRLRVRLQPSIFTLPNRQPLAKLRRDVQVANNIGDDMMDFIQGAGHYSQPRTFYSLWLSLSIVLNRSALIGRLQERMITRMNVFLLFGIDICVHACHLYTHESALQWSMPWSIPC